MEQNLKNDEELEESSAAPLNSEECDEAERQRILQQYICCPDWKMSLIAVAVIGLIYLLFFF